MLDDIKTTIQNPQEEHSRRIVEQLSSLATSTKSQNEKLDKSIEMLRDKNSSQLEELIRLLNRNVGYSKNIVENQ